MSGRFTSGRFIGIACVAVFVMLLAPSFSTGAAGKTGFAALVGKRVPGTSSAWLPIASPYVHSVDVAGTSTPPLVTDDFATGQSVSFFEFRTASAAAAFYSNPPLVARLISTGVQAFASVSGATGGPAPSRWLDLRECLWSGGPGQGGSHGAGTPSGGTMNTAGKCSKGTPSSIGFAVIMRRGATVAIAQTLGGGSILGSAGIQAAIDSAVVSKNKALASNTSQLLKTVGLS